MSYVISGRWKKGLPSNQKDKSSESQRVREIRDAIHQQEPQKAFQALEAWLQEGASTSIQAQLLSLVADGELNIGHFKRAIEFYDRASQLCRNHPRDWLRPRRGIVHALLKNVEVERAYQEAGTLWQEAEKRELDYKQQLDKAYEILKSQGKITVMAQPHRGSVVATDLGDLFLKEGEFESAKDFFQKAIKENPKGGCRARQGLALIALRESDPTLALQRAREALLLGKFQAKTISAWALYIKARYLFGEKGIDQEIWQGLQETKAPIRARSILEIVRALRGRDELWETIAQDWLQSEGQQFPIIAAELRKTLLAHVRSAALPATSLERAQALLQTEELSPNEFLNGAREMVRCHFLQKQIPPIETLLQQSENRFGKILHGKVIHGLALTCYEMNQPDQARTLFQQNLNQLPSEDVVRQRSLWMLGQLETEQGNYETSATLFYQFTQITQAPVHFRLQAQIKWAIALLHSGKEEEIAIVQSQILATLSQVEDWETLLNFSRQLIFAPDSLKGLALKLITQAEAKAKEKYEAAVNPTIALSILFKLTRRLVLDFKFNDKALSYWQKLDEHKKAWLWTTKTEFWEYLALVFRAMTKLEKMAEAEKLIATYLNDPATPSEGCATLGIPYSVWKIKSGDKKLGFSVIQKIIQEQPLHWACAEGYYWLALQAWKQNDLKPAQYYAEQVRRCIGPRGDLLFEYRLDSRALLLLTQLDSKQAFAQAPRFSEDFLQEQVDSISRDLEKL